MRFLSLCVFAFFIVACQKVSIETNPLASPNFLSKGRIGVLSDEGNFNARFIYSVRDDVERLELWGPAGSGHVIITAADGFAALTDTQGNHHQSRDIDTLIQRQLGYPVPASSFRYWLDGRSDERIGVKDEVRFDDGSVKSFVQNDWKLKYGQWVDGTSGLRPHKIKASNSARNVRISIKLDEWNDTF